MKHLNSKSIKAVIFFILGVVFCFIILVKIPYFKIQNVNISFSSNVSSLTNDLNDFSQKLKGKSIFNASSIVSEISSFPFVSSVSVKKYYPSSLDIDICFKEMMIRCSSASSEVDGFFLADENGIYSCSSEVFEKYFELPIVKMSGSYCNTLLEKGIDKGFRQMSVLCNSLKSNNLITNIKYDNNDFSDFGCLNLYLDSRNAILRVLEPVEPQRLKEALGFVSSGSYDLYSSTLVKRNQEDGIGSR